MQNFKSKTCIESHVVNRLEEKIRLQEYAVTIFQSIQSKSALKKSLKKDLISLNGEIAKTSDWIENGQVLKLYAEENQHKRKVFELKIEVIYEDEHLAIVNKPGGYPSSGNYFRTIENALPYNLVASSERDKLINLQPVHRLDNPTSGVLLIAKTHSSRTLLSVLFEKHQVEKQYIAIVEGKLDDLNGEIQSKIEGKASLTKFQVETVFQKNKEDFSLVNLWPRTGRTHQLRIHLASKGHPIVGDKAYNSNFRHEKLLLHAYTLQFRHPKTQEILAIKTEFPHKFVKFMNR